MMHAADSTRPVDVSRAPARAPSRTLPHNLDIEASILGGVIVQPESLDALEFLETDDFYHYPHRIVFEAIRNLVASSTPIDVVTLEHEIGRHGKLDAIGGVGFLGTLALLVPTVDNVLAYAHTAKQLSRNRQTIVALSSALERAYNWPHDPAELVEEVSGELARFESKIRVGSRHLGRTWDDCVEEIYARKDEPWIDLRIRDVVVATCRNGSFVPLIAPSGAGKSTLGLQMLIDHALSRGPAVYLTYELDGDEAVGRGIGQLCGFSWGGVLRGEVPRATVPKVPRLRILERDDATLERLERVVEDLRRQFPSEPIFVVADYLQATPAPPGKERGFVANVSSELRRIAKKLRVVLVGVSQASTANSKAMRSGELLGIDASATGAETAQIERDAYVILALGDRQPVDHETTSWKLSVAKYRLGVSDLVYELHYRGRVGSWEPVGDPRSATEVRDTRSSEMKEKKMAELKRSITALVSGSPKPLSQKEIIMVSTGKEKTVVEAIRELLREGVLVHMPGARKGGHASIWVPEKLVQEGGKS